MSSQLVRRWQSDRKLLIKMIQLCVDMPGNRRRRAAGNLSTTNHYRAFIMKVCTVPENFELMDFQNYQHEGEWKSSCQTGRPLLRCKSYSTIVSDDTNYTYPLQQ